MSRSAIHKNAATAQSALQLRRVTQISVSFACMLLILKALVWWHGHSVAMLASLADTALDLLTSSIMFMAVRYAVTPADEDHRFGHGKAEAVAALAQGLLTFLSGLVLIWGGLQQTLHPQPIELPLEGIAVSLIAIISTFILVTLQNRVVRATNSIAINADRAHYQGDLWLNLSVMLALGLASYTQWKSADGVFAMGIGVYLLVGGGQSVLHALDMLMDKEWPLAQRDEILNLIRDNPDVHHVHELRTRSSGLHQFAQFHIWVDPQLTVAQGHDIAHAVEAVLHRQFPLAEFLIHVEPDNPEERH